MGRLGPLVVAAALGAGGLAGCSGDAHAGEDVFDVTDASSTIVATDDGTALRLAATVVNTSDEVLDGVQVTVVLDEATMPYLVTGAVAVPLAAVDGIYPQSSARADVPPDGALGIDFEDTRHLDPSAAGLSDVLELAAQVTLEISWDGGEQQLAYGATVEDPDGLLGR
ncbi:hypothetical protein [Demequina iriomotensis]|uniref:hypothetical protein n=1 Tax=Demequina iriomotensis TaxID=1536641 RepID=UPI0012E0AB96|nr:hypothetical protein [Demequina iriomotensis]